jgi:hypothetical protein
LFGFFACKHATINGVNFVFQATRLSTPVRTRGFVSPGYPRFTFFRNVRTGLGK